MDPNSTNYGGSNAGAGSSSLGGGTDSFGVTGTGAGQGSAGGLTPSSAGSQSMGGGYGSSSAEQGAQNLSDRLGDVKDQAADKLSQARDVAGEKLGQARDVAGEKLGQAREVAGEKLGQAKEKATELKATLADKLDQGAQSLRNQQGGGQQFAGANGATMGADSSLGKYAAPAAGAMEATAQFLRGEGDIKGAIEEQVRTAPGRTLLIAVGLGYVLGKAIRR